MRKYCVVSVLAAILSVLFISTASAQSAPRALPANDDFANAKPIVIGKNYTVQDIEAATIEAGQPAISACGGPTAIQHGVWFHFSLPMAATIHLSTEGTTLSGALSDSFDTVLAVFRGATLGTLVQMGCNNNVLTAYSELSLELTAGSDYYVLAGTYEPGPFGAESVFRLNTRMIYVYAQFNNYSFEDPLSSADWRLKNASGDDRVCADLAYPALAGACAFRFVGNAGEASKLKQTILNPIFFAPRKNGLVVTTLFFRIQDGPLGPVKVTTKATYLDGTPSTIRTISLAGIPPAPAYKLVRENLILASSKVAALSFEVKFKSTTGTLLLDSAILVYAATASTREGVLPAPLAANW